MEKLNNNEMLVRAKYALTGLPEFMVSVWRETTGDADVAFVHLEESLEFPGLSTAETLAAVLRGNWENNGTFLRLYHGEKPVICGYNDPERVGINPGWAAFMLTQRPELFPINLSEPMFEHYKVPTETFWASYDAKKVVKFRPLQTGECQCRSCCLADDDGRSCADCSGQHLCAGGWAGVFEEAL